MPGQSPIPKQSFGRTFIVAAGLLGAVAVVQFSMVGWAFMNRTPAPPTHIDVTKLRMEMPPPEENPEPLADSDPLGSAEDAVAITPEGIRPVPIRIPTAPPAPPVAERLDPRGTAAPPSFLVPKPTPVPLSAFTPKVDPRVAELIEQGKLLRSKGDTAGALVKFREASAMDAGNPTSIAEMAYTFEKMSVPDKAAEQWRRIIAMGEGAGVLYSAAKAKLDMAVASTARQTAAATGGEVPTGKLLALGAISIQDDQDPASEKKFVLQVPIRSQAGAPVAVRDVRVYVHFFEKLNGKDIVRTAANMTTRWSDPPADWRATGTETLEVTYDLPRNDGGAEPRTYYGYIVRILYAGELQDTLAEPAALLKKFPTLETSAE